MFTMQSCTYAHIHAGAHTRTPCTYACRSTHMYTMHICMREHTHVHHAHMHAGAHTCTPCSHAHMPQLAASAHTVCSGPHQSPGAVGRISHPHLSAVTVTGLSLLSPIKQACTHTRPLPPHLLEAHTPNPSSPPTHLSHMHNLTMIPPPPHGTLLLATWTRLVGEGMPPPCPLHTLTHTSPVLGTLARPLRWTWAAPRPGWLTGMPSRRRMSGIR